ncbi:MAG: hypothetical protein RSE00_03235 [Clostridia bacterium]
MEIITDNEVVPKTKPLKEIKKIGRFTFGISLIIFGIGLLIQMIIKIDMLRYVLIFWPVILIILGCEILYYCSKKHISIRYDVFGIFLMFVVLFFGTLISAANFGINKVLYDTNIKEAIIEDVANSNYVYSFDGKINLNNASGKVIPVTIIEDINTKSTDVRVNLKYNKSKINNIVSIASDKYSYANIYDISHLDAKISFINNPEWLENIEIKVITNNRANVVTNGLFEIK